MSLRLGEEFPDFSAETNRGHIPSFHEWMEDSWAVLFSHPADFTPVCTTELARVAELGKEFALRNVKPIALSCDTAKKHQRWILDICTFGNRNLDIDDAMVLTEETFPFEIIADVSRTLIKRLGMEDLDELDSKGMPLSARAVFIIGPDKRLKLSLLYPATTGRNFSEILRCIDSLQLTAEHNVATPADWIVGDKCMVNPRLSNEEAHRIFPIVDHINVPSGEDYLRMTNVER